MKKDKFYKNSFLLTLSNLTTGVLGFMFSIILSRELGAEGMGLYGLVMPIYNLFICLICAGVITAISKLSAVYYDKNEFGNLKKTVRTTIIFNLIWALLITFLVFIFAPYISKFVIKDERTLDAIRITCPAMVFICISNIFKGYFYGISKITVPAFIDIFEKAVRIGIILVISKLFSPDNITATVTSAYIALCIGEFISLLLLYIYYKKDSLKLPKAYCKTEGRAQLLFNVLVIAVPLCLNGFLSTTLATVSTLIVPRRLLVAGFEYSTALSLIGKFTGMTLNIVFFPMIVISSISTILIPDLSQTMNKKDIYSAEKRIYEVLKISFLLGLSTLIICNNIPDSLGVMFFNRNDLGPYIKFASLCAPLFYCAASTYGMLNGLGKQSIILRNSLVISIIEVFCLYILTAVKNINIFGYGITIMITSVLTLCLNLYEINKVCKIRLSLPNILINLFFALLIYYLISYINLILPSSLGLIKYLIIILLGFSLLIISMIAEERKEY
ncbi:stage V sporulation protein B [Desnuesiella massiliensis]|uniref:stage V sporulation protein B n=1 Tax=Desnuesiella massiliensis TaxID=1650662 RepID=UPI0006E1D05A|nr:stage V sporulation protein B [Desnuesiella massiliensis]